MEEQQAESKKDVKYRAFKFGLQTITLLERLPKNYIFEVIGKQLLRSATSIGANIVEAQAGRTRKDFTNYYHIALKSANETKYWLAILINKIGDENTRSLMREAIEIRNILGASLLTLKHKRSLKV